MITRIVVKELPGNPPYAAVDQNDNAPGFVIKVVTKNIGTATARKSKTFLKLESNLEGSIFERTEVVGRLTPGMYRTSTFKVDGLKPHLGILLPVAKADDTKKIRESHERNNSRVGHIIRVVARRWKVVQFQTLTKHPGIDTQAFTATGTDGFVFYLTRFDESRGLFEYKPFGPIRAGFDETGPCTSHGSDSKTENPWPGQLWINKDLVGYHGFIDTEHLPEESAPLYCGGKRVGTQGWAWQNLATVVDDQAQGYPKMSPDDTQLKGEWKVVDSSGSVTWTWTFQADVVYTQ